MLIEEFTNLDFGRPAWKEVCRVRCSIVGLVGWEGRCNVEFYMTCATKCLHLIKCQHPVTLDSTPSIETWTYGLAE